MKKLLLIIIILLSLIVAPSVTFAQGMMGSPSSSINNTAIQSQRQEEQEGKRFLDDLNNKTITCSQLKDADFEKIGEYFMGQAIGDTSRHIAMNEMMKGMMGEQGEEQMHIAWGKRGSGCDTSSQNTDFMPMMGMMQMMRGGQPSSFNQTGNSMMWNFWGGFGSLLFNLSLVVWLAVGILAAIWLFKQISKK